MSSERLPRCRKMCDFEGPKVAHLVKKQAAAGEHYRHIVLVAGSEDVVAIRPFDLLTSATPAAVACNTVC